MQSDWSVADPGFPVGGIDPLGGHGPLTRPLFTENHAEMKELGPVGGMCQARPPDPPMLVALSILWQCEERVHSHGSHLRGQNLMET